MARLQLHCRAQDSLFRARASNTRSSSRVMQMTLTRIARIKSIRKADVGERHRVFATSLEDVARAAKGSTTSLSLSLPLSLSREDNEGEILPSVTSDPTTSSDQNVLYGAELLLHLLACCCRRFIFPRTPTLGAYISGHANRSSVSAFLIWLAG